MIALFVETLALMGGAYLLGAALACLLRRALHRAARPVPAGERRVDPLPEIAARLASASRFARGGDPRPAPAPQPAPAPAVPGPAQDLRQINGIDTKIEAALNALGIDRYQQIAQWTQQDVAKVRDALSLPRQISRENWIEQAQVLANGGLTYFARRRARGETASAEPTADEGERAAPAAQPSAPSIAVAPRPSTGGAAGVAAGAAQLREDAAPPVPAAAAQAAAPETLSAEPLSEPAPVALAPAVPVRPTPGPQQDKLRRIGGIDAEIEKLLVAQGVVRYSQIAHWAPADVRRFEQQLGGTGRIARENWIEQAQILSRGGDTAYSREFDRRISAEPRGLLPNKLPDAIREHAAKSAAEESRVTLETLRSVRSQAYQDPEPGPEAAQRAAAQDKVVRSGRLDDLKRIRGIGVLIEKRLSSMGVATYEQIANWTAQDIDRVSQSLDFKGRIERENWVEQARILASGGATEFARRVDRGEVEMRRPRG